MRRVVATGGEHTTSAIRRVIELESLSDVELDPELRYSVLLQPSKAPPAIPKEFPNVDWIRSESLERGDVITFDARRSTATVLYRPNDQHHSLFMTNRCNSNCLMCSQPPTRQPDGWLVDQAVDVVRHIEKSPRSIGLTGGEPTLLGDELIRVTDALRQRHPATAIEVLTNGRRLGDPDFADSLLMKVPAGMGWLVPLYGHADFLHDFVVQAPGAFDETIGGLLNLRRHEQAIQLRVVLIRPVLENLPTLCTFIGRNLPFVHEVALMGCEPIGFALANEEHCRVNLGEWHPTLLESTAALSRHRVPFTLMNTPLCALPPGLRPYASRSISDWKNSYAPACERCAVKSECSGLFAWHSTSWTPAPVVPIEEVAS
jgi:His-Xaa-Ser system radical SAM maturase HxsC